MYVIPQHDSWTVVLNRNVTSGSQYDDSQDLVRAEAQLGQLTEPSQLSIFFGHIAPKQCNLRIYYGKTGAWLEFKEK